jgi:hypothetical protein
MTKPSAIRSVKRIATRRHNAAKRKRMAARRKARALVKGGSEAARTRLENDGACNNEAVRRRILWFAHEHKLAPTEIEKALTGRVDHIGAFIKRHEINYDWMLFGDLKGLRQMPMKRSSAIFTATDVVRLYAELTMQDISLMIAALLNKAAAEQS